MPEVGRLHGGCGTLPSSGTVSATESVTALQSPPGVIDCAIQHFSVSAILFLETRIIWVWRGGGENHHLNCQFFLLPIYQQPMCSMLYVATVRWVNRHNACLFFFFFFPRSLSLPAPPSHQCDCQVDSSALLYNLERDWAFTSTFSLPVSLHRL